MNKFSFIVEDSNIAFITLHREPVNALSEKFILELSDLFDKIRNEKKINVLIITSSIKHFSAGADLKERISFSKDETIHFISLINNCFNKLENLPFPTICAINGHALGGGLELSLCCDFRVAETSAILGFPEASLGIMPGAGGTQRLSRIIGLSKSKYWIYSSRKFEAEEAFVDGVVDFISNDGEVLETAIDLADELNLNAPLSLRSCKKSIMAGIGLPIEDALDVEFVNYSKLITSKDRFEALKAFKEKRKPKWLGE